MFGDQHYAKVILGITFFIGIFYVGTNLYKTR